jgi:capsular polysaccharide biosynthesis protein
MSPVFPNKKTFIPIGFIVGILLGFTIGFLREFFDHTFKRPEDVDNYLGLPTILSIPEF